MISRTRLLSYNPGPWWWKCSLNYLLSFSSLMHEHEQVMEPVTPGPVVVVVDCPTAAYLPSLTASPALARCMGARGGGDPGGQTTASGEGGGAAQSGAACVIHLAPAQVGYCFTCNSTLSKCVSKCICEDSTQVLGKDLSGSHLPVSKWRERTAIHLCSDFLHAGVFACLLLLLPPNPYPDAQVVALPDYRAWMARFSDSTTHIVTAAGGGDGHAVMKASALMQARWTVCYA